MAEKEKPIGHVTHYYPKIGVAIIKLSTSVSIGDQLHFKGKATDFSEELTSLQIEHESVSSAKKGVSVGVKVSQAAREGDEVFRA